MATSRQVLEDMVAASLLHGDSGEKNRAAKIVPLLQKNLNGDQMSDLVYWLLYDRRISSTALKTVDALI